jgi:UDP-N-acetylmuramoyl-tripeptide--D-alanyl-D-alanine ligase
LIVVTFGSLSALAFLVFAARRLLVLLRYFQQEEYDGPRFLRWLGHAGAFDRRATLGLLAVALAPLPILSGRPLAVTVFAGFATVCAVAAWFEANPLTTGKKKLAPTQRARRILAVAGVLALLAYWALVTVVHWFPSPWGLVATGIGLVLLIQLLPVALALGNLLLAPFEQAVQRRILREAQDKLARLKPTVIAITGSYGKTSTKHVLGHVLSTVTPTLITPGSVNTPMGISRVVRETLSADHRVFVVEMGAYGPGSIARLCGLTPPDLAAITAIGPAHYERFRTLETVADAKFEIATAALARGGQVILNGDQIDDALAGPRVAGRSGFTAVARATKPYAPTFLVENARQGADGIAFTLVAGERRLEISAPLYGLHQIGNVAVVAALALALGLPADSIVAALKSAPQTAHRLEVVRRAGAATVIDDAYNSNPTGFAAALDVLALIADAQGGRRVLVTPGMVELGVLHEEEHRRLGRLAGDVADVVLVVAADRIPTFLDGLSAGARTSRTVLTPASFAEARAWMAANLRPEDTVLLENDLPDLYEDRPRF